MAQFSSGGSITVETNGQTIAVNITAATGALPTVYSDEALSQSVSFPDTITTNKTYYVGSDCYATVSCSVNGTETATADGSTRKVILFGGTRTVISPSQRTLSLGSLPAGISASRIVGSVSNGSPPTSGTFRLGDVVVDTTYGVQYLCTVAGTPGTWVTLGGGKALATQTSSSASSAIGSTPTLLLSLPAVTAGPLPLKLRAWANQVVGSASTGVVQFNVFDEGSALVAQDTWTVPSNGAIRGMNAYNEISYPVGTSKTFTLYGRCLTAGTATYGNPILGISVSQ